MPVSLPPEQPAAVQTVVVTAPRLPPSVGDAAFSIVRLDSSRIEARTRLDRALGEVPGASLFRRTSSTAANPTTQGMSLRSIAGSGAGRALVTLDGVPQNDPFGGWVIWSSLAPEAIEGASVVRGAGAGPYGAGALTGVVTLDELSRPGSVVADASLAELGGRRAAGATVQPVGETELFVSASGENNDGWIPVRAGRGAADDRLSLQDWSGAARLTVPVGRALMAVRVGAFQEDRNAGLVGAQSTAKGQTASVTIAAQPEADALGWRLQGWVRHSDLANSSVSVAAGRVSTTVSNNQYATPATGWGVNAALRGQADRITWELGADVRGADGEDQELFSPGLAKRRIAGGRTLVAGAYGEASLVAGGWLVTGGARLDGWASQHAHRIESSVSTGAVSLASHAPDRSGVLPSGRVGVKRDLGGEVSVRVAGYSGFRPPSLNELHRPFRVGNDVTEANPSLKPERLYGAEFGLDGHVERLSWSAAVFYNRLEDAIANVTLATCAAAPCPAPVALVGYDGLTSPVPAGGSLRQRQNAGAVEAKGIEADASYRLDQRISLRAAADYTDARIDGGSQAPQLTGLRPAQTPRLTMTGGAEWRVIDRLSLQGDLRYESARFDDDQNTRRLGSAVTVDARADLSLGKGLSLYGAADNLFDAAVATGVTADGTVSYDAPRVFRVGLTFRR